MSEIIYSAIEDSARESALNLYAQLQILEDNGKDVGEMKEEVFQRIRGFAEEDAEERLGRLREELKTYTDLNKELAQATKKP